MDVRYITMAVICWVLSPITDPALAQTPDQTPGQTDPDTQARALFRELMSPYCEGLLLADCPSSQAAALRDTIRAQLRRGQTPEAVVDNMVSTHGRSILSVPPAEGIGAVVWFAPIVALIAGLAVVAVRLGRRTTPTTVDESVPPAAPTDSHDRVRRELDEFDR